MTDKPVSVRKLNVLWQLLPVRSAAIALAVVAFLVVFEPFSVVVETSAQMVFYGGLGLVVFVVLMLNHALLLPLLKQFVTFQEKPVRIPFIQGAITTAIMVLAIYSYSIAFGVGGGGSLAAKILLISLLVGLVMLTIRRQSSLKQQIFKLLDQPTAPGAASFICLASENGKDKLQLKRTDIFYLKAEGNYVAVSYRAGQNANHLTRSLLLRSTISAMAQTLEDQGFVRCHRSYLVNLTNIHSRHSAGGNHTLKIDGGDIRIPVSKTYLSAVQEKIEASSP